MSEAVVNERVTLQSIVDGFPFYGRIILCNNVVDIDPDVVGDMYNNYVSDDSEEEGDFPEVVQFWLTDLSPEDVQYLLDTIPGIMLGYSEKLDLFIFGTTCYGISWEDVWYDRVVEK